MTPTLEVVYLNPSFPSRRILREICISDRTKNIINEGAQRNVKVIGSVVSNQKDQKKIWTLQ